MDNKEKEPPRIQTGGQKWLWLCLICIALAAAFLIAETQSKDKIIFYIMTWIFGILAIVCLIVMSKKGKKMDGPSKENDGKERNPRIPQI